MQGLPQWLSSKESSCNAGDTGITFSIPGLGRSPGGRNGNPLQYSCLKNPIDRGAWQATVHGVTESWTQLSDWATQYTDYCATNSSARSLKHRASLETDPATDHKDERNQKIEFINTVKSQLFKKSNNVEKSLVWLTKGKRAMGAKKYMYTF